MPQVINHVVFQGSVAKEKDRYIITLPKSLGEQLVGEEVVAVINAKDVVKAKVCSHGDRFVIPIPAELGQKLHKQVVSVTLIVNKPVELRPSRGNPYIIIPTVFTTIQYLQEVRASNEPTTTVLTSLPYAIKSVKQEQQQQQTTKKKEVITV